MIIGMQYGDEGKGRFVDGMAHAYDIVARFNGGPNAGHTVEANGRTLKLHQIPSGVNYPDKKLYIASECVVNPIKLYEEMAEVEATGLSVAPRLHISPQASVIQPGHILRDIATMKSVGTTMNGIGPTYADRASRVEGSRQLDIRMGELLNNTQRAFAIVRQNLEVEAQKYKDALQCDGIDIEKEMARFIAACEMLLPCIDIDPEYLRKQLAKKMRILLEGAQAFGLDKTYGITPEITSSNTTVAAAFHSTGIPIEQKGKAFGVAKLIPSRVGFGPFITEFGGEKSEIHCMADGGKQHTHREERRSLGYGGIEQMLAGDDFEMGIALRMLGHEYGASTGRPRRIGALDVQQLAYAQSVNNLDGIFVTKADQLVHFARTRHKAIPVGIAYTQDNKIISHMPTTKAECVRTEAFMEHVAPFTQDLGDTREWSNLPTELREMLQRVSDIIRCEILSVGVGPKREQVVHRNGRS